MSLSESQQLKRDFDDFNLSEKSLGMGQFGTVYNCIEKNTGKELAIKIIEKANENDESYNKFVHDVINKLQNDKNRAILPLYCYGEQAQTPLGKLSFIMHPLMKKGTLNDFINETKIQELDPTKKMILIYGTAVGMKYLNKSGIINKNLKPTNILLDEFYRPHISDFGFSDFISKGDENAFSIRNETPKYLAPEILGDSNEITQKVDVYSFGIIIFTGQQFIKIKDLFKVSRYVLLKKRPIIPSYINDTYKNLIEKCWNHSPSERPTFERIVSFLEEKDYLLPGANVDEFNNYKQYVNKNEI